MKRFMLVAKTPLDRCGTIGRYEIVGIFDTEREAREARYEVFNKANPNEAPDPVILKVKKIVA